MKFMIKFQLVILCNFLLLSTALCLNSSSFSKSKDKIQIMTASEQSFYSSMWSSLFMIPRTSACSKSNLLRRIRNEVLDELNRGKEGKKGPFWWVKQWGYGQAAYLFDFLDPVLQLKAAVEFKLIYSAASKFPQADSEYLDPFDFKSMISQDNSKLSKDMIKKLKLFTQNFDETVYNLSLNSVQIRKALQVFKWSSDISNPNYAAKFVTKYDMNFDGRLNYRELILGSIYHNQQLIGLPSPLCDFCYFEIGKTIDAIFLYLDCDNDGFLSAEEIWSNLPKMNRSTEQWNLFAFGIDDNIRTASINDFILKNSHGREGFISRKEFRVGLLLGFWDRQTEFTKIVDDNSRNMKNLRWKEDHMIDVALYNFYKKKIRHELTSK